MKMKNHASAVVLFAIGTTAAHAQSLVTLYGIIDNGLTINSNVTGHHQVAMISGIMQGSRWGLKGDEDLGGDLHAIFRLENGFDVDTGALGQGGAMFGRQSYVGLSDKRLGTLTLGRQYDQVVDFVGQAGAGDHITSYAEHPADLDNFVNSNRTNNSVKYTSIDYSGFKFGGMYSFGGQAGAFTGNQVYSVGAGYAGGLVTMGAAYLYAKNPNVSYFGTNPNSTGIAGRGPVISGYASAKGYQTVAANATYTIGQATLAALYSNVKFEKIVALGGETATFNNAEANISYRLTPALSTMVAYTYTKGSTINAQIGGARYNQYSAGVDYFLSKRTDVYAVALLQTVSGHDSTGKSLAQIAGTSASDRQGVGRVGIRHTF